MRSVLFVLVTLLFAAQLCLAQSTKQGAITGTISDASGGLLPGVGVTVTETKTGAVRTATTNKDGDFTVDFLQSGTYRVTAEHQGFKRVTVPDAVVQVSTVTRVDLSLPVGEVAEDVTISSEETQINTETPTLGEVIDSQKIQGLPLNGREFLQLAGLVPGANTGNVKRGAQDPGPQGYLSVGFNGARANHNAFYVDGADAKDPGYGGLSTSPGLDAIKEFRIETNMYSAQYGRAGGAVINVVTNSGTNDFHGTVYEYHRNKILDAAPFFDHRPYDLRAPYLFNQFGASVGGPVVLPKFGEGGPGVWVGKNKTFFFFNAEKFRQIKPGQLISSFGPTPRERIGDYTQSLNPWTLQPVKLKNPYTNQLIPSNILPAQFINPTGQKLMSLFPSANYSGDQFLNFRTYRAGTNNQDKYLTRIDHHFNSRNTLSATWSFTDYAYVNVATNTVYGDQNTISKDKTLVLTYTSVITNNIVNEFTGHLNSYNSGRDFLKNDKNYGQEWGVVNNKSLGSPRIYLYGIGYAGAVLGNDGAYLRDNKGRAFKDNLAWVYGNHTIKFGGEFRNQDYLWMYDSGIAAHLIGLLDGDPTYDVYYGAFGYNWADLLAATSTYNYLGVGDGSKAPMSRNTFGFYGQDDWKMTPRLTVNVGLRWDYDPPFKSDNNKFLTLNFDQMLPQYAAGAPESDLKKVSFPYLTGGPNRPYNPNKSDWAPRLGFAYRIFGDSTVLRGGYGFQYTTENAWNTTYGIWAIPFGGLAYYYSKAYYWPPGSPNAGQDHYFTMDQVPPGLDYAAGKNPGFSELQAPYHPSSYMQQWNLTVSRTLPGRMAGEIGYVGSKGTNLNGTGGMYDISNTLNSEVLRKVPGWSVTMLLKGYNSNYHSLQAKLRKDLSQGLTFLGAYTWGHAMAEASNDSYNENSIRDTDLLGQKTVRRWSNTDYDVRHRFTVSGNYQLPIGRDKMWGSGFNSVANAFLGGWDVSFIYAFQSGFPYNVRTASLAVPDRICDGNLPSSQRTTERWFDINCFKAHTATTVNLPTGPVLVNTAGNSANNIIIGPSINNVDLGVHKSFNVTETKKFEFRFESFNAFNHPQLIGPSGSGSYFLTNATGSKITLVREPRSIQLALKFIF